MKEGCDRREAGNEGGGKGGRETALGRTDEFSLQVKLGDGRPGAVPGGRKGGREGGREVE